SGSRSSSGSRHWASFSRSGRAWPRGGSPQSGAAEPGTTARRGARRWRTTGVAVLAHSVQQFWLGLLLIIFFAVDLHRLPSGGYSSMSHPLANLRHMVLPVIVLALGFAAGLMRQ